MLVVVFVNHMVVESAANSQIAGRAQGAGAASASHTVAVHAVNTKTAVGVMLVVVSVYHTVVVNVVLLTDARTLQEVARSIASRMAVQRNASMKGVRRG